MAMRFPDKKVSLDIVNGRAKKPVVIERNGWKILRVTYQQMEDYETCRTIMRMLSELLGSDAHTKPAWDEQTQQVNDLVLQRSA